jgi:preprotein translocase subunit YajC
MDFISSAFAQVPGSSGSSTDAILQFAPFGVILVIMYLFILRPQQRRAKQHQDLVKTVRRGDTIVTNAGLIGKVTKVVDDNEIEIEIAPNVRVRQLRTMISEVRSRSEPVKE